MTTPYRNDVDALRERKTALEGEISRLRDQTTQLDELRAREAELARELRAVEGRLNAGAATRRPLPLLDQVRIASPCKADWNEMLGDERVRFCLSCEKNVYNLSSMSTDEAESLLRERLGGEVCVRFYQRADGTILTQDCPVGATKKRRKKLALAVAGAGAMAAAAATMFTRATCRQGDVMPMAGAVTYQEPTMGEATDTGATVEALGQMVEIKGEARMGDVAVPPVMNTGAPHATPTPAPSAAPTPRKHPQGVPRIGKPVLPKGL